MHAALIAPSKTRIDLMADCQACAWCNAAYAGLRASTATTEAGRRSDAEEAAEARFWTPHNMGKGHSFDTCQLCRFQPSDTCDCGHDASSCRMFDAAAHGEDYCDDCQPDLDEDHWRYR
jgi:hypothetical protein